MLAKYTSALSDPQISKDSDSCANGEQNLVQSVEMVIVYRQVIKTRIVAHMYNGVDYIWFTASGQCDVAHDIGEVANTKFVSMQSFLNHFRKIVVGIRTLPDDTANRLLERILVLDPKRPIMRLS